MKQLKRLSFLDEDEQLIDKEFQNYLHEYKNDIARWWKDFYKYSNNDHRYLTATETQIYTDYLDHKAKRYLEEIGSGTVVEEMLKSKAIDPDYDINESKAHKESLKSIEIVNL